MRLETALVRQAATSGDPNRPLSTPIFQTALFEQPSASSFGPYDYTRSGNPTRAALERQLARLEGAEFASAFASGMAALTALTRLVPRGRIVAGSDLYGGTFRLLTSLAEPSGIEVEFVDTTDLAAVERALARPTGLVLLETPTNPLLEIVDLRSIVALAHARGALVAVDNSLLSPLLQRPLELGADLVVHSATKFLCGHGDATAGAVVTRDRELARRIAFVQNAEGNGLAPFEAWLVLRGLKTLHLRLREQQRTARRIARRLATAPGIARVHYPGLARHPGRELHESQASGPGSVLSFETGCVASSERFVDALRQFSIAVSFGGVHSSVSLPCRMSHASIPGARRRLPEDLVRLSVGVEHPDDLLEDLANALAPLAQERDVPGARQ